MIQAISRECDMFQPVSAWLKSRGYEVFAEVSVGRAPVDVIGRRDSRVVACEMKLTWDQSLLWKLIYDCCLWAEEVWYCCRKSVSKVTYGKLQHYGIGLFSCERGVLLGPMEMFEHSEKLRGRVADKLNRAPRDLIGGVPCLVGNGPRMSCERRIREYMAAHPRAKSREVFHAVPNHYATFASFSGVFGGFIRYLKSEATDASQSRPSAVESEASS